MPVSSLSRSLGVGLSLGLGMAEAARLDKSPTRVYVLLGDGEIQEGQIWEAAMYGAFHKVDNIVAIVDYNKIQLDGFIKDIMELEPLADKWRGFGWNVIEVDGHDIAALQKAFADAAATGPGAWSDWKESLVEDLVARARAHLAGIGPAPAPSSR